MKTAVQGPAVSNTSPAAFSSDGRYLSYANGGFLYQEDLRSGQVSTLADLSISLSWALSPDQRTLALGGPDGVTVRDLDSGATASFGPGPVDKVLSVANGGATIGFQVEHAMLHVPSTYDTYIAERGVAQDTEPPQVDCAQADSAWHTSNVSMACTASDAGSGLASQADASFNLVTSVQPEQEASSAMTNSRSVCDKAGNCATAGPVGPFKIDLTAPTVTLAKAKVDATAPSGAPAALYGASASDGAFDPHPAVSCSPDSVAIGDQTLTCSATDQAGNATMAHFSVHVSGAAEQVNELLAAVTNAEPPLDPNRPWTRAWLTIWVTSSMS
jgi:hypothetical protein